MVVGGRRRDTPDLPGRDALEPRREILTEKAMEAFGRQLRGTLETCLYLVGT